jgi:hypothetical protein
VPTIIIRLKNEKCEYENDGERITQPGKFEGEPIFAPYFWNLALEGFADIDNGKVYTFKITKADNGNQFWPEICNWLGRKRTIRLREDEQGFVHCF